MPFEMQDKFASKKNPFEILSVPGIFEMIGM